MSLKYVGMIFIFIFTTLVGNGLAISEKRKIERSEALREFIAYISREIECFRTPLDTIYYSFKNDLLEKNGFIDLVRRQSLKYALENTEMTFCLRDESYRVVVNFAEFLGKSEYSDQMSRCKYTISIIDDDIKKCREAYPKNRKMYTSLGVLSGIMIIILML